MTERNAKPPDRRVPPTRVIGYNHPSGRREDWPWPGSIGTIERSRRESILSKPLRHVLTGRTQYAQRVQDQLRRPLPTSLICTRSRDLHEQTGAPGATNFLAEISSQTPKNNHRYHSKHHLATSIIKSVLFIYFIQHICPCPHGHRIVEPVFALSDVYHEQSQESIEVTDRIDGILRQDSLNSLSGETPMDFIKQGYEGDKSFEATRHHNRKRQRSRRSHHRHSQQARAKRNNLVEGYLDPVADRPVVATNKGLVRGITQKIFTNKFVDAFLGIPFAQPPIGPYRFRHPRPKSPWRGEFDASHFSNSCYQVNDTFFGSNFMGTSIWNANTPLDEDCLYLNVWTPFGAANTTIPSTLGQKAHYETRRTSSPHTSGSKMSKRAVLVWIFGGGFYSGTSTLKIYEGGALASEEDIIVVSMNYRVSSLGFLYFGRPDAPGNAGMFDQLLALQWINDNIDQFGGDPAKVTIFGESAGAVSVAFHLLSPLSGNLFSQAILQSGAATCPWGSMDTGEIIANGLQLASLLNCPSNQSDLDSVMKCLLKADPMALVSQEVGQTRSVLNFPFVPVVDGSFLVEPPAESLSNSNFKSARVLLGSNNDEANSFLIYLPEFSNCPASGNSGSASDKHPNVASANEMIMTRPIVDDSNKPFRDTSDQTSTSGEFGSADTLSFGRQTSNSEQGAASLIHDNKTINQQAAIGALSSTKTTQKQQQQANAQNADTSKPCKPNDEPSLSRDEFLGMLREDLNPYAGHPIGKKAIVFEYSNWNNPSDPVSHYDAVDKIVGDYYFTCHVNAFAQHYAEAGNAVYMYHFKHRSTMSPWPKWMGVLHADEINFVFGEPLNPVYNYTQSEVELSKRIMKYWANFARYGNPTSNGDNDFMPERWPEYKDKRQYFELNSEHMRIGRGPRAKQCAFWSQYLPQLIQSFDKNDQCQVPSDDAGLQHAPLYPHSAGQLQGKIVHQRPPPHVLLFGSMPFFILFIFICIIIVIGLGGTYLIYSRGVSWKFDLWPGTSPSGRRPGDEDEEDTGSGRTANRNGQSRAG